MKNSQSMLNPANGSHQLYRRAIELLGVLSQSDAGVTPSALAVQTGLGEEELREAMTVAVALGLVSVHCDGTSRLAITVAGRKVARRPHTPVLTQTPPFAVYRFAAPGATWRVGQWNLDKGFTGSAPNPVVEVEIRTQIIGGSTISVQSRARADPDAVRYAMVTVRPDLGRLGLPPTIDELVSAFHAGKPPWVDVQVGVSPQVEARALAIDPDFLAGHRGFVLVEAAGSICNVISDQPLPQIELVEVTPGELLERSLEQEPHPDRS